MEKTKISLSELLPEAPDEKDECIHRIINRLQDTQGIDKVHLVPATGAHDARICLHYNGESVSTGTVKQLAREAGAKLTKQYGHLLISVKGIRHPRHARVLEQRIEDLAGVQHVSVSGTGFIQLEYEKDKNRSENLLRQLGEMGLSVQNVQDFSGREHRGGFEHKHHHGKTAHTPGCCGAHSKTGPFGEKSEFIFSILSGIFLTTAFALSFIAAVPQSIVIPLYLISYFFGGYFTAREAYEGLRKKNFQIDFLMLVAAAGAAVLGHWAEGSLLLFLFSLGHALEHFAMEKARKSISALSDLTPKTAHLKAGGILKEVPIETLQRGDILLVRPNTKIPADGYVIRGNSAVDQAPITGESVPVHKVPVEKEPGSWAHAEKIDAAHKVFAGTINGAGTLEIKVSRLSADTTIARLITLVNEAQTQKSSTQQFTNRIEKYYVPGVLITVCLLLLAFLVVDESFGDSFYRAMAVLVAASPCALAISTPSAVLSGVARAARSGVLIKGGKPLEELGRVQAIAFDKTGTLTQGKPKLTGVIPLDGFNETALLEVLVATEKLSDHPLASAITAGATRQLGYDVEAAHAVKSIPGRGIEATWKGSLVRIGNKELLLENGVRLSQPVLGRIASLEAQGHTTMVTQLNDRVVGLVTLMDVARSEARNAIDTLQKMGIKKMIMLTGDTEAVGKAIAAEVGLKDTRGNLLPEQKVAAIEEMRKQWGHIAMVGDGVNDAPAMAKSSVGIVMGAAGSDVALETADIALMADKLEKLPFAVGLSKKARRIIKQNLVISLGMVAILVPLTIAGVAQIGPAVVGHEGSTLIVVFNALRLLAYKPRKNHQA